MSLLKNESNGTITFYCPGCEHIHAINKTWTISGSKDAPTVSPSVLTRGGSKDSTCHLFIRNGMIEYLNDSVHELAGKIVPMVPREEIKE